MAAQGQSLGNRASPHTGPYPQSASHALLAEAASGRGPLAKSLDPQTSCLTQARVTGFQVSCDFCFLPLRSGPPRQPIQTQAGVPGDWTQASFPSSLPELATFNSEGRSGTIFLVQLLYAWIFGKTFSSPASRIHSPTASPQQPHPTRVLSSTQPQIGEKQELL